MPYFFDEDTSKIDADNYIGAKLATQFQAMKAYVDATIAGITKGLVSSDFWIGEIEYDSYYTLNQDDEHMFQMNFTTGTNNKPIGIVGFDTQGIRCGVSRLFLTENDGYYTVNIVVTNHANGGSAQVKPKVTLLYMRTDRE